MIIRVILFILVIFSTGCETKREREKRLKNEEVRLDVELTKVKAAFNRYDQQKNHIMHATAKERFAYLYSLKEYNGKPLKYYDYVTGVEVIEKSNNSYRIVTKMFSKRDVKINFYLFLYDDKGLIIGQYYWHNSIPFAGTLKKGQSLEKEFTITTSGTPSYFQISLVY